MADLTVFETPADETGRRFPRAISWAVPMVPDIMAAIGNGPTMAYAAEYTRVNQWIDELGAALATEIRGAGFRAQPLAASQRTDPVSIRGDFPHKTAATRAGLGWIGRHCQLITRAFGSWVRLGTVFSDLETSCGTPIERSHCGRCTRCVEACPAGALTGTAWLPGIPRDKILDVHACDAWKKAHFFQYQKGHVCGICSAVCPYGLKRVSPKAAAFPEEDY
ncbi:MAG: 4Fe-4S double cluster binding domain-containing protein [Syntrophobacteraceae bacterium]